MTDQEPGNLPAASARDDTQDKSRDGQWLSYAELGHIRGIGRESAKKLALKQGWRRVPGNDGANRVFVPGEWLRLAREPSRDLARDESRDSSRGIRGLQASFDAALKAIEASHASEVATLRERAETAEQGREAERARADAQAGELAFVRAALDQAQAAARTATQAAAELRRQADERTARGLLARLRAAWRGE